MKLSCFFTNLDYVCLGSKALQYCNVIYIVLFFRSGFGCRVLNSLKWVHQSEVFLLHKNLSINLAWICFIQFCSVFKWREGYAQVIPWKCFTAMFCNSLKINAEAIYVHSEFFTTVVITHPQRRTCERTCSVCLTVPAIKLCPHISY